MDIDISLSFEEDNVKKFLNAMVDMGMTPRAPIPAESILDSEIRKALVDKKNAIVFTFIDVDNPFKQIDVFLTDEMEYHNIILGSESLSIEADFQVNIASIDQLIEMKLAVRPVRDKDQRDIAELRRLKNG
jgi:hypothetical protein